MCTGKSNVVGQRVVLLGASNLTRALPVVAEIARQAWGIPLEFLVAAGHGRSYGQSSSVLGRELAGIRSCNLWKQLRAERSLPTAALITDVGNDILYGVDNETIAGWVTACVDDLVGLGAHVVLTELPLASLRSLGNLRYRFFRTLFFPPCRLHYAESIALAEDLQQRLKSISESRKVALIPGKLEWYGLDPIHIRSHWMGRAWAEILSAWNTPTDTEPPRVMPWARFRWYVFRPQEETCFGVRKRRDQPCTTLKDGSTLSLY